MSKHLNSERTRRGLPSLDARLAAYLASAGAVGAAIASEADGAVVSHRTPQAFGVNGEVNIDLNNDTQTDFQIDHDRVTLPGPNGPTLDYLQVDKNDDNGAANPLVYPAFDVVGSFVYPHSFPVNGTPRNNDAAVLSFTNSAGAPGGYTAGLKAGDMIGATGVSSLIPGTAWDFQEVSDFLGQTPDVSIRANRLIDEDNGQIDMTLGGLPPEQIAHPLGPQPEFPDVDDFVGLAGATRYVGVRVDLNDAAEPNLNDSSKPNPETKFWYGWIGVRIDNEADATGTVTGWAYESTQGVPIEAGFAGPGDFDRNGQFDGGDFLLWQSQFGSTVEAGKGADANGDTFVDAADYNIWKGAYGSATPAATSIPEPSSMLMAVLGGGLICGCWLLKRFRLRTTS